MLHYSRMSFQLWRTRFFCVWTLSLLLYKIIFSPRCHQGHRGVWTASTHFNTFPITRCDELIRFLVSWKQRCRVTMVCTVWLLEVWYVLWCRVFGHVQICALILLRIALTSSERCALSCPRSCLRLSALWFPAPAEGCPVCSEPF